MNHKKIGILFVCMGNICRSPTAEAVFRGKVEAAGLSNQIVIDSAGTHGYHIGHPPDVRSQQAARRRGYSMSGLRARQVAARDFFDFDFLLAMDESNLRQLQHIRPSDATSHLGLFLSFSESAASLEVPDPYYGGGEGFEQVLDLVDAAAEGLLRRLIPLL